MTATKNTKTGDVVDAESLRKFGSLSSLTSAQLERLAAGMSIKKIRKKEKIFNEGDAANMAYLLVSGIVRISWVNQEGRRVLVSLLPAGEFFGLGSLFSQKRHPFHSDAFSDCTVGVFQPETLVDILMGAPFETHLRFMEVAMGRFWRMLTRCVRGMAINLRKRLALELLELAASFGVTDSRGTIICVRPTHEHLANSIGASRQKVTECLADFERRHIVIREGRRLIVMPRRLREIIETG